MFCRAWSGWLTIIHPVHFKKMIVTSEYIFLNPMIEFYLIKRNLII